MPNYEVEHNCTLSDEQKDKLAVAITDIHANQFGAPKLFVNCRFTDISKHAVYVAGKRRTSNRIFASVRHGPPRTQDSYKSVSNAIIKAWDEIVPDQEMRMVIFFGSIIAGYEAGFMIPQAGGDGEWLVENWVEFQKKAEAGDEEFKDMIEDCKSRGLV